MQEYWSQSLHFRCVSILSPLCQHDLQCAPFHGDLKEQVSSCRPKWKLLIEIPDNTAKLSASAENLTALNIWMMSSMQSKVLANSYIVLWIWILHLNHKCQYLIKLAFKAVLSAECKTPIIYQIQIIKNIIYLIINKLRNSGLKTAKLLSNIWHFMSNVA